MRPLLGSLIVFACAIFLCGGIGAHILDLRVCDFRPGIGYPPEQHLTTIEVGMTKDEVRSVLGSPHWTGACGGDEWDYKCDFFGGSQFRCHFGSDGRVTQRYCWLN